MSPRATVVDIEAVAVIGQQQACHACGWSSPALLCRELGPWFVGYEVPENTIFAPEVAVLICMAVRWSLTIVSVRASEVEQAQAILGTYWRDGLLYELFSPSNRISDGTHAATYY